MRWFILLFTVVMCFGSPCVDIHFSPYAGAENIITLHSETRYFEDLLFPHPKITVEDLNRPEDCPHFSSKNQWLRKAKSACIGVPLSAMCLITQHEVFGHGYRVRDLGAKYGKVEGYKMYVVGGSTSIDFTESMTSSLRLTVTIAGLEADAILANKIRLKWLSQGYVEGRQAMLGLMSSLSFTGYACGSINTPKITPNAGNDIANYIFYLNATYPEEQVSYNQIRYLSLLNFLNPFIYYSILAQGFYDAFCIPTKLFMLPIGDAKYLPSFRMALTPFGLQGYLENFLVIDSVPTFFYFKWGKNGGNIYWGVGFENSTIFKWKTGSLGFRMDLWQQPNILFEQGAITFLQLESQEFSTQELYPTSVLSARSLGAAFSAIGSYGAIRWPFRIFMELGYKTAGYLPGEALRESPIVRGGFAGQF
ncbi:MAG: hypothetical protein K1X28_08050 [Parachlamydiales bacterium]|nr:hypothetical protein [Parachlamydiales bacterium]